MVASRSGGLVMPPPLRHRRFGFTRIMLWVVRRVVSERGYCCFACCSATPSQNGWFYSNDIRCYADKMQRPLNPKSYTLNPKSYTLNPEGGAGEGGGGSPEFRANLHPKTIAPSRLRHVGFNDKLCTGSRGVWLGVACILEGSMNQGT